MILIDKDKLKQQMEIFKVIYNAKEKPEEIVNDVWKQFVAFVDMQPQVEITAETNLELWKDKEAVKDFYDKRAEEIKKAEIDKGIKEMIDCPGK